MSLAVLVLLTVGAGIWLSRSANDGPITRRSDLQKLPEEHLFYPGATLLGSGGNDYAWGIWGSNPATSGHTLGVDASQEEVLAFYDRELAARGWQKGTGASVGSDENAVAGWHKEGMGLRSRTLPRSTLTRHPTGSI